MVDDICWVILKYLLKSCLSISPSSSNDRVTLDRTMLEILISFCFSHQFRVGHPFPLFYNRVAHITFNLLPISKHVCNHFKRKKRTIVHVFKWDSEFVYTTIWHGYSTSIIMLISVLTWIVHTQCPKYLFW